MQAHTIYSPAASLLTLEPVDWSRTALGAPAGWPAPLRMTVDLMLNCPLAMVLMWGRQQQVMFYNAAYAALSGAKPQSVPGGKVPSMLPAAWTWNNAAIDAAWAGDALHYPAQSLPFWRDGATVRQWFELRYTPLRDGHDAVAGVLCALQPGAEPASAPAADARPLRILVVEDNQDALYLVCEMLRTLGHEVDAVGRGEDAVGLLDGPPYDLLFSDVGLPGMSGVDLARLALRRQPRLNVVFASGYGDALTRHLDFAALSMQKPYDIEQLQAMLSDIGRRVAAGAP